MPVFGLRQRRHWLLRLHPFLGVLRNFYLREFISYKLWGEEPLASVNPPKTTVLVEAYSEPAKRRQLYWYWC